MQYLKKAISVMFSVASSKDRRDRHGVHRISDPASISISEMAASIDGSEIKYRDVVQAVLNNDTVADDGIGGSMFVRTIPSRHNPARLVKIYNLTFDDNTFPKAHELFGKLESFGANVKQLTGKDDLFREMFFIPR